MDDDFEIEFGKEYIPTEEMRISGNEIFGPFWSIKRMENSCVFEFDTGSHGSGLEKFETPISVFDELKNERVSVEEVIDKYWGGW